MTKRRYKRPREEPTEVCAICGKPIIPHVDAVYSIPTREGKYRHYECWDKHDNPRTLLANLRTKLAELDDRIDTFRKKMR